MKRAHFGLIWMRGEIFITSVIMWLCCGQFLLSTNHSWPLDSTTNRILSSVSDCKSHIPYPHGQFGIQVPNNYFNYCKLIMHLQQYFNHYSTPMNNINGKFGIITVVCCLCYIHPSSWRFKLKNTLIFEDINFIYFGNSSMNFINFGQWGLVFITYFGTSQNDLYSAELAMQIRYCHSKFLNRSWIAKVMRGQSGDFDFFDRSLRFFQSC